MKVLGLAAFGTLALTGCVVEERHAYRPVVVRETVAVPAPVVVGSEVVGVATAAAGTRGSDAAVAGAAIRVGVRRVGLARALGVGIGTLGPSAPGRGHVGAPPL